MRNQHGKRNHNSRNIKQCELTISHVVRRRARRKNGEGRRRNKKNGSNNKESPRRLEHIQKFGRRRGKRMRGDERVENEGWGWWWKGKVKWWRRKWKEVKCVCWPSRKREGEEENIRVLGPITKSPLLFYSLPFHIPNLKQNIKINYTPTHVFFSHHNITYNFEYFP